MLWVRALSCQPNEFFRDLCLRIPGVGKKCVAYYSYLRSFHNYGHLRVSEPGFTFPDPFDKRCSFVASRMLSPGVPFRTPAASFVSETQELSRAAHKLNSDALNPDFQSARLANEAFQYAQASVLCAEAQVPQLVYRHLLDDNDRHELDHATTMPNGHVVGRAYLIDASDLDVVPKPIFCKNPKDIPKNAINGRYLKTRLDYDLFMRTYYKELFNMKRKNVMLHGYTRAKLLEMGITAKPISSYYLPSVSIITRHTHFIHLEGVCLEIQLWSIAPYSVGWVFDLGAIASEWAF